MLEDLNLKPIRENFPSDLRNTRTESEARLTLAKVLDALRYPCHGQEQVQWRRTDHKVVDFSNSSDVVQYIAALEGYRRDLVGFVALVRASIVVSYSDQGSSSRLTDDLYEFDVLDAEITESYNHPTVWGDLTYGFQVVRLASKRFQALSYFDHSYDYL